MTTRTACDYCGKELAGRQHLSLSTINHQDNGWGEPINAHFCNLYACLNGWMKVQAKKFGWDTPQGKVVGQGWPENGAVMDITPDNPTG